MVDSRIGLTVKKRFIPIEQLSLKELKIFRNQIKRQGLDKLEFYKEFLK